MKTKFIRVFTISLIFVLLFTTLFSFGASARVVRQTPMIEIYEDQSYDVNYYFGFDITRKLTSGQYRFSDVIGRYNIDVSFIQDYLDDENISYDVYRYFPIVVNIDSETIGLTYYVDEVYYNHDDRSLYSVIPTSDSKVIFFPSDFTLDYDISFTIDSMPEGEGDGSYNLYLMIPLDSEGMQEFIPYSYTDTFSTYFVDGYQDGYDYGYDYGLGIGYSDGYDDGYGDGLTDSSDIFSDSFYSMIYESLGEVLYSGNSTTHSDLVLTLLTSLLLLFILLVPILLLIFIFKLVF